MPYDIRKAKKGGYDIVRAADGKVVGHSETKKKAEESAGIRMSAEKKKQRRAS